MTRDTFDSLPGIAWALITTTSSGEIFTCLCSCAAISDSALIGSPCEPVHTMHTSSGASFGASSMSMTAQSGMSMKPRSRAIVMFCCIDRPTNAILRPLAIAACATCCTRCRCDAKLVTMNRLSGYSRNSDRIAAPTVDSDGVNPGRSAFVESDMRSRTPPSRLAMSPSIARFVRRPSTGVRSSLKSPL